MSVDAYAPSSQTLTFLDPELDGYVLLLLIPVLWIQIRIHNNVLHPRTSTLPRFEAQSQHHLTQ